MAGRHHHYREQHVHPRHHAQSHEHAQSSKKDEQEKAPEETVPICPFSGVATNSQPFDGGKLLTDPNLSGLDIYKKPLPMLDGKTSELLKDGNAAKYGCLDVTVDGAQNGPAKKKQLDKIPSINDMLQYGKELGRIATGDKSQPDFKPLEPSKDRPPGAVPSQESDEAKFKRSYVNEAVLLGEKQGIAPTDMKKILLGIYSIEGFGRIPYDMQSGTSFKYSAADDPGSSTNENERRNSKGKISSAVGYNQITYPANLHLLNDDNGAIAGRLRDQEKDEAARPTARASELEQKAKFIEQVQTKLHEELMTFALQNTKTKAMYLDRTGEPNAKLYADFSKSQQATSTGLTGKELTTGLHSLLLDADVGPILQARQLDEDIEQTMRPEFQKYLDAKMKSSQAAAVAVENLLADAACKRLTDNQLKELQVQWDKLRPIMPADTPMPPIDPTAGELFHSLVERFERSPMGLMFQKNIPTTQYGDFAPAGAMACNLAGPDACRAMFQNSQSSTRKFMSSAGYRVNPVLHGVNVDQFLHRLLYQMSQKRGPGTIEFEKYLDERANKNKTIQASE